MKIVETFKTAKATITRKMPNGKDEESVSYTFPARLNETSGVSGKVFAKSTSTDSTETNDETTGD